MNFIRKLFFICFACLLVVPVQAYYPKAEVDIKNSKMAMRKAEAIDDLWFQFLQNHPESVRLKGKKYSIDQFCRYSIETNENGDLLFDTIKLVKQKRQNPEFNLLAIEFLRNQNLQIKKRRSSKPLTIDFKYYAF